MGKMHELLSVEADVEGHWKRVQAETNKVFKTPSNFYSAIRTLVMFDENATGVPDEHQAMVTTVEDRLEYNGKATAKYFDVIASKEATNQVAVADLVVDGVTIGTALPATLLLGLESRLKKVRAVYEHVPTLDSSVEWVADAGKGEGILTMLHPEKKLKTAKQFKHQVLVEATEHHRAEIEKWEEQVPVGEYTKRIWCSMISSAEKAKMLGRIDKLIQATKKARQRANSTTVVKNPIGDAIMDFISG